MGLMIEKKGTKNILSDDSILPKNLVLWVLLIIALKVLKYDNHIYSYIFAIFILEEFVEIS